MTNQQSSDNATTERPQALVYLRCASGHQEDRDRAIVAQHHVCTRRAEELNAVVVGEFVDFGSGLNGERPGMTALLARLSELRAQNAGATIYVIVKDHARIARSMEAYSRISWQIEEAGALLNVASIPLAEYEALSGLSLGGFTYGLATERSRAVRDGVARRHRRQSSTNGEEDMQS